MTAFKNMSKEALAETKKNLQAEYDAYKAKHLSLNMARGIPSKAQLELSMGLLDSVNSSTDLTGINGADYRNYGILDGIPEAKQLFADLFHFLRHGARTARQHPVGEPAGSQIPLPRAGL